jgi:oligoribonuclease (3'-5' exoribonuclease)
MSEQPEALRLADELLANHGPTDLDERVAAELRRLHAVNAELLEALRDLVDAMTGRLDGETIALHNALIVIAKAEAA